MANTQALNEVILFFLFFLFFLEESITRESWTLVKFSSSYVPLLLHHVVIFEPQGCWEQTGFINQCAISDY